MSTASTSPVEFTQTNQGERKMTTQWRLSDKELENLERELSEELAAMDGAQATSNQVMFYYRNALRELIERRRDESSRSLRAKIRNARRKFSWRGLRSVNR
jgi:hypothetical protein